MSILARIWHGFWNWLAPSHAHSREVEYSNSKEEDIRAQMLADQRNREEAAKASGSFAKKQPALYHHKATGEKLEAHVVGVHDDDDPQNPYYTINYLTSDGEKKEKQTTGDRLYYVDWDEERSWNIISEGMV